MRLHQAGKHDDTLSRDRVSMRSMLERRGETKDKRGASVRPTVPGTGCGSIWHKVTPVPSYRCTVFCVCRKIKKKKRRKRRDRKCIARAPCVPIKPNESTVISPSYIFVPLFSDKYLSSSSSSFLSLCFSQAKCTLILSSITRTCTCTCTYI